MDYQSFWYHDRYALVGHSAKKPFPTITCTRLQSRGKTVYPIDPDLKEIGRQDVLPSLQQLPVSVPAVIIEVPPDETAQVVKDAIERGIKHIWIHQGCDTPEAIALATGAGVNLCYGTCAVMYLATGYSVHTLHRWINKRRGKY